MLRFPKLPPFLSSQSSLAPSSRNRLPGHSIDRTYQLGLQNKLALLILLRLLVRLIVFPPDRLLTLPTADVPHDVSARRHVPLDSVGLGDVDDRAEEVGFAVLAAEGLEEVR